MIVWAVRFRRVFEKFVINNMCNKQILVIMEKLEFRPLTADEIECRVGTVTDSGCSLLMYKDARVDMKLLDEVVGPMNWKREHELINGNLFCTVSVYDRESGQWVSKQDVGVESNTEKEKGQASDAFKRACVNWGIGRELYTCPFVWINLGSDEWRTGGNGRKQPKTRFEVVDIETFEGQVTFLRIVDDKGRERFKFGKSTEQENLKIKVIDEIWGAKTREEVEKIFREHPEFKDNLDVIEACTGKCNELKKVA